MIIDAKTGTINAVLFGKDSKEGGVSFAFRYPARVDILTMDNDQIFKAICEIHMDISPVKYTVYDIKLTFTADPVPINSDEKELSLDGLYKSFKQALEEIDQQNKVIGLAVSEVCRCRGAKGREEDVKRSVAGLGIYGHSNNKRNGEGGMKKYKFRAWYPILSIMFYDVRVGGFDGDTVPTHFDTTRIDHNWLPIWGDNKDGFVMQCTGLKDKNGAEIYEGDILQVDGEFWELFWKSSEDYWPAANYQLRGYKNKNYCKGSADAWMCSGPKVVGNIYENPELLKDNS